MAKYVDGFVLVIPKDKVQEYTKMANEGRDMWMKHGALAYYECKGDDLQPKSMGGMQPLGFLELTKATADETVWFSYIEYASKEHRDEVNAKVMAHWNEKFKDNPEAMTEYADVLDMKRMSTGGFNIVVSNN
jgi:uncharacterized protein YbaA (DUF1428 family)